MANKRRQAYKRKSFATKTTSKDAVYRETLKQVQETNARLKSLERRYKTGTWASKKLMNRLDSNTIGAVTGKGRIKITKNMTTTQLKAVQKATRQFLDSKTSTKKGINETIRKNIESIQSTLSDDLKERVDFEDAEFYYDMFGDNDFDYFADKIGASTLWVLIDEAIENNDSESGWIGRLGSYITLNDEDVKARAIRLYYKYIG